MEPCVPTVDTFTLGGLALFPPSPLLLTSSLPGTTPLKNFLYLNLYLRASGRGQAPYVGVQSTVASESSWSMDVSLLRCHLDPPSQNAPRSPVTACPEHTAKVKLAFSSSFCSFFFFFPNMSQVPGTEQGLHVIVYCW